MSDKPIKVLLIEDNPADTRLIQEMIAEARNIPKLELEHADRLSTGLKRLAKGGIDVVFLDLSLPDSQGLDTLIKLHEQASQLPIVVLTGLADQTLGVKAVQKGAQDYLVKGQVDSNLLVRALRYATERKRAEEALIQSKRLRALGEMAAGVAHDFSNLLAIILGNAQLLERGMERYKAEEIKDRLKIIARTALEGGETVRRLQHFTRREVSSQDFTKIDLNEIVREAIASTSPSWKDEAEAKGTRIKIKEKLGKLPPLWGSRSELMEVLTNLIFNALEAMREGGEITVRTKATKNEVLLYFTDTGKGIPHKIKEKIFDPFFTTKGPKASGLGLSICYGIIKRHQGKIKVESSKEKGTTFTISIPIGLEAALRKEKLGGAEKISSRRVLIIDDEEGIREVLGTILHGEGHRVTLAETARKGLEKFKQDNFDLVLTDLGMSEMSGWQLAKKIRKIDPGISVGLITGWAVATTKEKMKEEGVDFILSKPFDYTKVVREVDAVLKSKKR
jgi:signal transduction histidine kinase